MLDEIKCLIEDIKAEKMEIIVDYYALLKTIYKKFRYETNYVYIYIIFSSEYRKYFEEMDKEHEFYEYLQRYLEKNDENKIPINILFEIRSALDFFDKKFEERLSSYELMEQFYLDMITLQNLDDIEYPYIKEESITEEQINELKRRIETKKE